MLAAVGEQSDKPMVSTFLAAEGVPELLRVPDVAGCTAGRGSVPSYLAVEAAVRALARVVEYAAWLRGRRRRRRARRRRPRRGAAQPSSTRCSMRHPEGRDLDRRAAPAARRLRHQPVGAPTPVATSRRRPSRRRGARLGRRAQGDRRPPAPPRPTWPTSGATSTTPRRWRRLGLAQWSVVTDPDDAGFVVQRNAPAGVPGDDRGDRGPALRAGACPSASPAR